MKNSDESEIPEKLDYSKLPKDVERVIKPDEEEIVEESKITFDGRQFLVRFPSEISKLMKITNQDKIRFVLKLPRPRTDESSKLTIEIIKNEIQE